MPDPVVPALDADVQQAHLFLCLGNGRYAISNDPTGQNIPQDGCTGGWKYIKPFALGVREPLPIGADPEPVVRALRDVGFFIWKNDSLPHGTAQ